MENLSEKEERDPIELMADEFLDRRRNGEDVTIEEYEQKHPDLAEEIRQVLNAMLAMEDFKPRQEALSPKTPFDEMATGKIRQLGEFRILRKIAHGGMGVVYEAEEKSLGRRVAIKVLANHLLSEKSTVERFHREAKAIANLHHTNIVSVFGAGFEKDLHFYVMQYVDGMSLEQMIKSGEVQRQFKNNWKWITEVVRRVALALRQAHLRDILHRDVKPGNILIDSNNKPWVTDFGLAKFGEQDDLTRPGDAVGTLRYMAPEQLEGRADPRSDLYGLGLVLYELCTAQQIYANQKSHVVLSKIGGRELQAVASVNPAIPRDLAMIVNKSVSKSADDRYQSAIDLVDDLDRWQRDLPVSARPLTTVETVWRWAKRSPLLAGLCGTIATLFLVLTIALFSVAFARINEKSALLDAKIANRDATTQRAAAENNVEIAMEVLDQLTNDLSVFNRVNSAAAGTHAFLFSPYGGSPVSALTEKQLLLIDRFYKALGRSSGINKTLLMRRNFARIRMAEISIQLGRFEEGIKTLLELDSDLREVELPEVASLQLCTGDLLGYAHMQIHQYDKANLLFERQLALVKSLGLQESARHIEVGKALLGQGLSAHQLGNIRRWHGRLLEAIDEFEKVVDMSHPENTPLATLFLSRTYLNLPPRFNQPFYNAFAEARKIKAIILLRKLQGNAQKEYFEMSAQQRRLSSRNRMFLYDYCVALSMAPPETGPIEFSDGTEMGLVELLTQAIQECQQVVEDYPEISAYRLALAICQLRLGEARYEEFEKFATRSNTNIDILVRSFRNDSVFLTESGNIKLKIGSFYLKSREYQKARDMFQLSISSLEQSQKSSPDFPRTGVLLSRVHQSLSLVFDEMGEQTLAQYHLEKSKMHERSNFQNRPQQRNNQRPPRSP